MARMNAVNRYKAFGKAKVVKYKDDKGREVIMSPKLFEKKVRRFRKTQKQSNQAIVHVQVDKKAQKNLEYLKKKGLING